MFMRTQEFIFGDDAIHHLERDVELNIINSSNEANK